DAFGVDGALVGDVGGGFVGVPDVHFSVLSEVDGFDGFRSVERGDDPCVRFVIVGVDWSGGDAGAWCDAAVTGYRVRDDVGSSAGEENPSFVGSDGDGPFDGVAAGVA